MNRLERGRDGAQTKAGLQWYTCTSKVWVLRWAIKKRPITPDKPLCPLVIALVSALLRVQECLFRERKPEKPRTPREAWPAYCSAKKNSELKGTRLKQLEHQQTDHPQGSLRLPSWHLNQYLKNRPQGAASQSSAVIPITGTTQEYSSPLALATTYSTNV